MTSIEQLREEMSSEKPPPHWELEFKIPGPKTVLIAGFGHTREEAIEEARDAIAGLYKVAEDEVE